MRNLIKQINGMSYWIGLLFLSGMAFSSLHINLNDNVWSDLLTIFGNVIIGIAVAMYNAEHDKDKIIKGWHYKRFTIRTILFSVVAILTQFVVIDPSNIWKAAISGIMIYSIFGVFFDLFINFEKDKAWDYTGEEAFYDQVSGFATLVFEILIFLAAVWVFMFKI